MSRGLIQLTAFPPSALPANKSTAPGQRTSPQPNTPPNSLTFPISGRDVSKTHNFQTKTHLLCSAATADDQLWLGGRGRATDPDGGGAELPGQQGILNITWQGILNKYTLQGILNRFTLQSILKINFPDSKVSFKKFPRTSLLPLQQGVLLDNRREIDSIYFHPSSHVHRLLIATRKI